MRGWVHVAIRVFLEGDGIETSDFRARQCTTAMVARSDIIVTAASEHRSVVLRKAPSALRRTFTVCELADLIELAERGRPLESPAIRGPIARLLASITD